MGALNTRISLRYDTYDKWNTPSGKAAVLNTGEVGICAITSDGAEQPTIMFKVGNGVSTFEELPWTSGLAADVYDWAKAAQIAISEEGAGEVITNIYWDEGSNGIKVTRKTLTTESGKFATQGMIASQVNGVLVFSDASISDAVVSVKLV